ncbi:hypothetical protein GCM10011579_088420 [Streptomyces albiflavescens]|uniref:Secreted protein n=1 Tax=Streptomyces albiflavescens TaxID=1623582 RepID=A0A917YF67_9ACTN|nr:hypothetical protein [Streptomyces albiflavescens]GGN91508.1 hypothetical protein GCM10011579_088420 [Streptomyces albiflavescens]
MYIRRVLTTTAFMLGATVAPVLLGVSAAPAVADSSPSASASPSDDGGAPTEAGTSFRTATEIEQGQQATASGSTGDYLYWSFPADAGQRPTVKATVKLPEASTRSAAETWQIDVYDGLRRRQACQYGAQTRTAAQDATSVDLSCTLRTVRAWSETWANDPLPGTYYIRLTATGLGASELGLPVSTEVKVDSKDIGGSAAVDGSLAKPLVPGIATSAEKSDSDADSSTAALSSLEPDDGWTSGWWSDRWVWTAIGGILAALAGIGGYALTRGAGRPSRVTPGA